MRELSNLGRLELCRPDGNLGFHCENVIRPLKEMGLNGSYLPLYFILIYNIIVKIKVRMFQRESPKVLIFLIASPA